MGCVHQDIVFTNDSRWTRKLPHTDKLNWQNTLWKVQDTSAGFDLHKKYMLVINTINEKVDTN